MSSTNETSLQALYRLATRGLPEDPALRLSAEDLLQLASAKPLVPGQERAVIGLASSASQADALRLLEATATWSSALAAAIGRARRPSLLVRLQVWWRETGVLAVAAAAGMVALALLGLNLTGIERGVSEPPALVAAPLLFLGEFEPSDQVFAASLENRELDPVFSGSFDG